MGKKKKKKPAGAARRLAGAPESGGAKKVDFAAGWVFWIVVFVLLYAPAWYWTSRNAFSDVQSGVFPWAAAFILAAIGAGLVSWVTNSALQWWSRRVNRLARRKH